MNENIKKYEYKLNLEKVFPAKRHPEHNFYVLHTVIVVADGADLLREQVSSFLVGRYFITFVVQLLTHIGIVKCWETLAGL